MDKKTREKIIEEYQKGKSSHKIVDIVKLSKPTILKVLNEENIVRKRDRCEKLNINEEENGFSLTWKCNRCQNDIKRFSKNRTILCRNHYRLNSNNSICKKCSLELQVGEGNPFYGKKHSIESLKLMSKVLTDNPRKFSSSSKPEKKIEEILKELNYHVNRTHRINEYICDLYLPDINLVIEYNGDYWHCNPTKFDSNYLHPHKKKLASQIWEEDKIRVDNIKKYGYNLEVIWESDFDGLNSIQNIIKKYVKN